MYRRSFGERRAEIVERKYSKFFNGTISKWTGRIEGKVAPSARVGQTLYNSPPIKNKPGFKQIFGRSVRSIDQLYQKLPGSTEFQSNYSGDRNLIRGIQPFTAQERQKEFSRIYKPSDRDSIEPGVSVGSTESRTFGSHYRRAYRDVITSRSYPSFTASEREVKVGDPYYRGFERGIRRVGSDSDISTSPLLDNPASKSKFNRIRSIERIDRRGDNYRRFVHTSNSGFRQDSNRTRENSTQTRNWRERFDRGLDSIPEARESVEVHKEPREASIKEGIPEIEGFSHTIALSGAALGTGIGAARNFSQAFQANNRYVAGHPGGVIPTQNEINQREQNQFEYKSNIAEGVAGVVETGVLIGAALL